MNYKKLLNNLKNKLNEDYYKLLKYNIPETKEWLQYRLRLGILIEKIEDKMIKPSNADYHKFIFSGDISKEDSKDIFNFLKNELDIKQFLITLNSIIIWPCLTLENWQIIRDYLLNKDKNMKEEMRFNQKFYKSEGDKRWVEVVNSLNL